MILEVFLGTLNGLLGTVITSYINYKMKRLEGEQKLKEMQLESDLMIAEVNANIKVAQATADIAVEQAEADAFTMSIAKQKSLVSSDWIEALLGRTDKFRVVTVPLGVVLLALMSIVDVVNHLMRPALTLYSLVIASWVTYQSWVILKGLSIDTVLALNQWGDACDTVMLLAVTMVTWWFGDRRVAKHLMHQKRSK